jgi:hypothetical protein
MRWQAGKSKGISVSLAVSLTSCHLPHGERKVEQYQRAHAGPVNEKYMPLKCKKCNAGNSGTSVD